MAVLPITPAEVKLGAGTHVVDNKGFAREDLVAGKIAYFDDVSKGYKLADSAALATAKVKGMVLNSPDDDQPVSVCLKGKVIVGASAAIRAGGTYVVNTNGDMVEADDALHAIGKYTSVVGIGLEAEDILLNPTVGDVQLA